MLNFIQKISKTVLKISVEIYWLENPAIFVRFGLCLAAKLPLLNLRWTSHLQPRNPSPNYP